MFYLALLERVFLRLGSAETDEQLQASVCKFLPPVLLKLSSGQEGVRKKVMELLIHINKRIKSRPQVQLPVEALLLQYQDPSASSFVIVCWIYADYYTLQDWKKEHIICIYIIAELYNNIYKVRISSNGNEQTSRISSKCIKCY